MRIFYRARQFWLALTAVPKPEDLALAQEVLSPALMRLFLSLQPSEQAHSLWIYRQLRSYLAACDREVPPDLLAAALLHDVGKSCHPLRLWERVEVVLGKAFFPAAVKGWGTGSPSGWKRAFVVAEQHPAWGADLAQQAGATPLAVALIRRHQENLAKPVSSEDEWLALLQRFDEER